MVNVTSVKHICFIFLQLSFVYHDFYFFVPVASCCRTTWNCEHEFENGEGVMRDGTGHGTGEEDKVQVKY